MNWAFCSFRHPYKKTAKYPSCKYWVLCKNKKRDKNSFILFEWESGHFVSFFSRFGILPNEGSKSGHFAIYLFFLYTPLEITHFSKFQNTIFYAIMCMFLISRCKKIQFYKFTVKLILKTVRIFCLQFFLHLICSVSWFYCNFYIFTYKN